MHRLTIIEAIIKVMKDAGEPLAPAEAYKRITAQELYEFHAQRPLQIVVGEIRRHCKDIIFPSASPTKHFGMTLDGKFFPLSTPFNQNTDNKIIEPEDDTSISFILKQIKHLQHTHRELIKERIINDLKKILPASFEFFSKKLLEVYGFVDMNITAVTGDGGIDGYGKLRVGLSYMRVAFQCKRWSQSNVGRPEIDKFRGAIQGEYEQGIFFTTASFSPGAKLVSIKPGAVPVILIDGPSIAEMMIDKQFGVDQESLPIYTYSLDSVLAE